jgi:hypothetical protein
MVEQCEQPTKKTAKEIAREAEKEISRAAHLAKKVEKGKRHNGR